jgi:hypothetical protein
MSKRVRVRVLSSFPELPPDAVTRTFVVYENEIVEKDIIAAHCTELAMRALHTANGIDAA